MDQKELREWEAKCIQEEPPACRAGCPLNVDARAFVLSMARGDLDGARAVLEKSMPLAAVTARLCEAPCEVYCIRKDLGGAIAVGGLERQCIRETSPKGKIPRLPARPRKVAVIGSGPSSLTVAFDLARKGHPISVYHLGEKPGGWLRGLDESFLPQTVLDAELQRLGSLHVTFVSVPALDAALIEVHPADAMYVGQDDTIAPDLLALLTPPDPETMALERPGWFTGGMAGREFRFISAVSQGREAAVSIDRFLQNASLTSSRVPLRDGRTDLFTQTFGIEPVERVVPAGQGGFTREEAVREAGRCLDCQCLECVKHCVYLAEHGGYPKSYARRVFNNSAIVQGMRQANTFINSCSMCGQCETLCPNDFSMADMCLDARREMVDLNRMPPSAHWFALEEMRSAKDAQAALIRHAPGASASDAIFFPGCQLAGIRPEQTLRLYDRLLEIEPRTGIWLDCCAAPAHWAGRREEFAAVLSAMEKMWSGMGRPMVVTACSTCLKMFREHLPAFGAVSVWTLLSESGVQAASTGRPLALSDPCTSRHDAQTRDAVRSLLARLGQPLAELPMSGELTECCGFGGLMDNANPALARKVAQARVAQSEADFLTYCAMCREQLARTGKPVLHILDLLFPETARPATEPPAGISARRVNRRRLKDEILARHGLDRGPREPWEELRIVVADDVAAMLEERRILEDDVRRVLFAASKGGRVLRHGGDGRLIAASRLGEVTFWVEYREGADGYEILKAWSHRMRIAGGDL
ncbi:pyridine nucleotide-disulfide oxidoreductase/dicluster-binding protein [Desulfomicrobium salsuginis]